MLNTYKDMLNTYKDMLYTYKMLKTQRNVKLKQAILNRKNYKV